MLKRRVSVRQGMVARTLLWLVLHVLLHRSRLLAETQCALVAKQTSSTTQAPRTATALRIIAILVALDTRL